MLEKPLAAPGRGRGHLLGPVLAPCPGALDGAPLGARRAALLVTSALTDKHAQSGVQKTLLGTVLCLFLPSLEDMQKR